MKFSLFALFALFGLALAASSVTNEVLFIDQDGNVSRPEALATQAQMAANAAAILTAEQKAEAAAQAAREGTNLVQDIIRDITANELVVYRHGYTDAFGVVVVLDPDAKLIISDFSPLDQKDGFGRQMFTLEYALQNSQAVDVKPQVRWHTSLAGGVESFTALDDAQVSEPTATGGWESAAGEVYPFSYRITFSADTANTGFFIVYLSADDASGDGWTFDLPNGVTGGATRDVVFGDVTLTFTGGILTGVN